MNFSQKDLLPKIFINYRIDDTFKEANRLSLELQQLFGEDAVFFDIRSIEAGEIWDNRIEIEARSARLAFILIGKNWFFAQNKTNGRQRLEEVNDWVRREIEIFQEEKVRIIPVLINNAQLPDESAIQHLPILKNLIRCQTIDLRNKKWKTDFQKIVDLLKQNGFEVKNEDNRRHEKQNHLKYLSQLIEKYRWLKLQDFREAGSLQIELEKVYIALKTEPETEYELYQSSKLHETEVLDEAGEESTDVIKPFNREEYEALNIRRTYRPARDEVKRARITEVHTLGDAFRQHHRIVILGGPGSGKTTLGRWLALQLAKAFASSLETKTTKNVTVLRSLIDPDFNLENDEQADIGPARLPIFLRISHYARELALLERGNKPSISLKDYLGRDPDSEELQDGMTADLRNKMFCTHLTNQEAVVILDGLDELSDTNRGSVIIKIQDFIRDHVPETDASKEMGLPCEMGGNQVIVTSRYVGYKYNPIRANCAHFGVQPMNRSAVERFVRSWSNAVNTILTTSKDSGVNADQLILEIYNSNKPRIRELATNPLLITILATVYWRDGKLPDQRAGVYNRVIDSLVEVWLKREECKELKREQLMAALEPLAADLQENASNNGLVSLNRIREIIENPLAHVSGIDDPSDWRFREKIEGLLETIRKHVGLLAEQSAGNYAFFHRTFQEFLAARHLLANRATAAQRISEKLDDPIWREPLLLALGFVMIDWGSKSQIQFFTKILEIDEQDALIPRAALLLNEASIETQGVPDVVLEGIVIRLLTSYSISMGQSQALGLRERIEQIFIQLRHGSQTGVVIRLLANAIRRPVEKRDLAFAVANIIRVIDWYTDEIVDSLLHAVGRDSIDFEWPICQALFKALNQTPNEKRWVNTATSQTIMRLEESHLPMRKLLKSRPDLVAFVREDWDWLALLIALYGGLDQAVTIAELQQYQKQPIEHASLLASKSSSQIKRDPATENVLSQINFSPQFIFWDLQDTELSRLLQQHLAQKRPARELADTFWNLWKQESDVGAGEALVGLAALGEDVIPILRESLNNPKHQKVARNILNVFSRLRFFIRGPLRQTSEIALRTIPEDITEQHQFDLLRIVLETHISNGGRALRVGTDWPEYNFISIKSPEIKAALDAEFWAYVLSGASGDDNKKDLFATVIGAHANSRVDSLLQAWYKISHSIIGTSPSHPAWSQPVLAPRPESPVESYLALLDAMEGIPTEYHTLAGYVLAQCRSILDKNPFLVLETLAICHRQSKKSSRKAFIRGYQMNRTAVWDATSRVQAILDSELVSIATDQRNTFQMETMFEEEESDDNGRYSAESYLQFRTLSNFPEFLVEEPESLEIELSKSIERMTDPVDRLRAIEFLIIGQTKIPVSNSGLPGLISTVTHLLPEITDPENRICAFCQLAMFLPVQVKQLLSTALDALDTIPDTRRKVMMIDEIRTIWGREPEIASALDAVSEKISDLWERDKALNRKSRLVNTCRTLDSVVPLVWRVHQTSEIKDYLFRKGSAKGTLAWTLLYLFNTANEVEKLGKGHSSFDELWNDLLDSTSESAAGLIAAGLDHKLPITTRNIFILDRVLQKGQASDLEPLWQYLGRPEPGAVATISRWSSYEGMPRLWSALVQAEAGRLTPEVISSLIDLLGSSTDLLRLRASLALHGPIPYTTNPLRRWRISHVGSETLEVLAQLAKRPSNSQSMLTTIGCVRHDIHHDDPKAVEKWLEEVNKKGVHSPAAWLIAGMESADREVISILLSGLHSAHPDIQEILLIALSRIAFCSKGTSFPTGDIHKDIAVVSKDIRSRLSVLPEGTKTLLNSVQDAIKETESGYAWQQALILMNKSSIWLDETSLSSSEACLERLKAIGGQQYVIVDELKAGSTDFGYHKGSYWANTDKAVASLNQDDRILEMLIELLKEIESTPKIVGYSKHLLTATEAVARKFPDLFARLANPEVWEPLLSEWAVHNHGWAERLAAIRLLGRLRRVTPRIAQAIKVAMEDDPYVQQATYASIGEFRYIEGDVFQDVLLMLGNTSTATSAAAAKLLVSAAKAGIDVEIRRRIINTLQENVRKPSAKHPVYQMETRGSSYAMFPKFVGTLDEIFYRAIFEISGL